MRIFVFSWNLHNCYSIVRYDVKSKKEKVFFARFFLFSLSMIVIQVVIRSNGSNQFLFRMYFHDTCRIEFTNNEEFHSPIMQNTDDCKERMIINPLGR